MHRYIYYTYICSRSCKCFRKLTDYGKGKREADRKISERALGKRVFARYLV